MNEQEQDHKLRLGIAKIEDLFIKNKLSEVNDGGELENINLIIPDYQRPYKWTVGNVIRLLDDIEEAWKNDRRNYRVGTLILHHDEKDNNYNIVDGQQRTVTFSLILKAFSNVEMLKGYFPIENNNSPNFNQLQLERNSFNISSHAFYLSEKRINLVLCRPVTLAPLLFSLRLFFGLLLTLVIRDHKIDDLTELHFSNV